MNFPIVVILKTPVSIGDLTTEAIKFNRGLKVKDLMKIEPSCYGIDRDVKIISRLTGVLSAVIEDLDYEDWAKCQDILESFLGISPTIGKNELPILPGPSASE